MLEVRRFNSPIPGILDLHLTRRVRGAGGKGAQPQGPDPGPGAGETHGLDRLRPSLRE